MTIVPIILISILIVGTFAFVLSPLFDENGASPLPDLGPAWLTADELVARRDAIYAALKEAEFDRETGKLTDEDYQTVRARYMTEAARILRQLDHLTPQVEAGLDAEIEQAVTRLRTNRKDESISPQIAEAVESEINSLIKHASASGQRGPTCPDCGKPTQAGDAFCAACGASLTERVES